MDPLTHTATGLFLARAGLKRWTPLAVPIMMLAANAPDIDAVSGFFGSVNYLHYHRLFTHSLVMAPVMAALPMLLVRAVARRPVNWIGAYFASLIGVATHLALDWTNPYGIRLLLPFSDRWLRLDQTEVVDLWIWAVLLLSVMAPLISRLVGSEIASSSAKAKNHGRGFARFALAFLLLYNCGRAVLHGRAVEVLNSRIYQGANPARVAAVPHPVNPFQWRGVVETADFYALAPVNLLGDFDPTQAAIYHKPEPDPAIEAARRTRPVQEFLRFAQYPLWRIVPMSEPEGGKLVEVIDMRFGSPTERGFKAGALLTSRLDVVDSWFSFSVAPRN